VTDSNSDQELRAFSNPLSRMNDSQRKLLLATAALSDPRITLGLYGHVIPKSQRDAVSRLAQLLTDSRIADPAA